MRLRSFRTISLATLVVLAAIGVAVGQTGMDQLVTAAKQEGQLTTIALPHDWCGYGELISSYKSKYGIKVNELNPDAGSGDEIEAIKANKGNKGPQAPDVIDVGLSFGPSAKKEGLLMPHKVATLGHDPQRPEGQRGLLVRRLLRRARVRDQRRHRQERPTRLGGPPQAGVQELGRPRR